MDIRTLKPGYLYYNISFNVVMPKYLEHISFVIGDGNIFIIPKIFGLEAFISSKMSKIKGSEIKYEWEK